MFFNSLNFALFFPVVYCLYWFVTNRNLKTQNILLLLASYFFYACWDYRFLFLLIFSTLLDYFTGIKMAESKTNPEKSRWFWISVVVNLGFLGVFKYYDFFITSFAESLNLLGFKANVITLNFILPVGISFYTFHGLSYVIDIYKDRIKPERNFIDYSVFVSFFPLLVAGPIERATHLLPQILKPRQFDKAKSVDGLRQILWGLFKKVVIADNCATYANLIFNNCSDYSGATLFLGGVFFAIQIYCDFSGYSDIALGTARLLGIELLQNFSFPYFSRDIAEFWRRWHISLSSWFRDYLYIPLGGSKGGTLMKVRNTFIIFIVSGFWHGANWTFLVWGALNAVYFLPLLLRGSNRENLEIVAKGRIFPSIREFIEMTVTFALTVLAWIFFRSETIHQATAYIVEMASGLLSKATYIQCLNLCYWEIDHKLLLLIVIFFAIEWLGREGRFALANFGNFANKPLRWMFYLVLILLIFIFSGSEQQFIYFQF